MNEIALVHVTSDNRAIVGVDVYPLYCWNGPARRDSCFAHPVCITAARSLMGFLWVSFRVNPPWPLDCHILWAICLSCHFPRYSGGWLNGRRHEYPEFLALGRQSSVAAALHPVSSAWLQVDYVTQFFIFILYILRTKSRTATWSLRKYRILCAWNSVTCWLT